MCECDCHWEGNLCMFCTNRFSNLCDWMIRDPNVRWEDDGGWVPKNNNPIGKRTEDG